MPYQTIPYYTILYYINPLNAELNSIWLLLALLGAHRILHFSGLRVKLHYTNTVLYHTFCIIQVLKLYESLL